MSAESLGGLILVVDDEPENRELLSRRLTRQGHRVVEAENGRRALECVASQDFDVILLDLMMPEMDGYEVLTQLKLNPSTRHVPVIVITGVDDIQSVVRCIELGAEDYLPKPFNPVILKARLNACLEKKKWRDREVSYLRQIESEKQRADDLLGVILPPEIVAELKANNYVKPRRYENVAVMFCDIVGFTPYCATRNPEEIVGHLQELVVAYEELALKHRMQKIKTIGDSFMCTAGLCNTLTNPVLNAVRCGLDMLLAAHQHSEHWDVRVGIHVGPVMGGVVGSRQYLFDLWGDTVNTAARIESHGTNGAVNVSGAAWDCVRDLCRGESLGVMKVKGKGRMELYRVDSLLEAVTAR